MLLEFDDEAAAQNNMHEIMQLHLRLVSRGTAHLALTMANIMRTSWLAAAILSPAPPQAQTAAVKLLRHIWSIAPDKHTSFESYLAKNVQLMKHLEDFAHRTVPVCVWQGDGEYKALSFSSWRCASCSPLTKYWTASARTPGGAGSARRKAPSDCLPCTPTSA